MKILLLSLTGIVILVVLLAGGTTLLAEAHPFQPSDPLYMLQFAAESIRLELIFDKTRRAEFAIELAERRLDDLVQVSNSDQLNIAARYLNDELSLATRLVLDASLEDRSQLLEQLSLLIERAELQAVALGEKFGEPIHLALLLDKLASIRTATSPQQLIAIVQPEDEGPTAIAAESVLFVGEDFDHSFYPLI
ncbi:MAG: hypothetical protein AMJ56_13790, partial [Anaerolineae bacterium SG8_19]